MRFDRRATCLGGGKKEHFSPPRPTKRLDLFLLARYPGSFIR
jgi:hypothetical protein